MVTATSQIVFLLIIILYAVLLYRTRLNPKVIRASALVILIAGILVHVYALSLEHYVEGPVTTFFRALFMTLEMFVYGNNLIELEAAQEQPLFLECYMIVFYSAVLTSISAIIMLFGKRAMSYVVLLFRKKKFRHVFIGTNSRSYAIARGIEDEEIAFIEFPSDSKKSEISVGSVLKGMEDEEGAKWKGKAVVLTAKRRLKFSAPCSNVFATIGLDRLKKLIDADTAFYILSEDSDRNLDELMTILADADFIDKTIHVSLSREGIARYYKTTLKQTRVHFIYPSSLSVVELMKNHACHPSALLQPALDANGLPDGTYLGEFNALVAGFGETGQAVTKFLYESSALLGQGGEQVRTRIIVNDTRIDSLKGPFIFDNPALGNNDIIRYENLGTESSEFWEKLKSRLDTLNYIAVSLDDDASNLNLACTIFMYALKNRRNGLDGLRIVVRKRETLPHERKLVERMNEKAGCEVIVCYGEYDKIFTTDMIVSKGRHGINRSATGLADRIADAYSKVTGSNAVMEAVDDSFHEKNRARMELHQMISRANRLGTVSSLLKESGRISDALVENLAKGEHLRYSRYLSSRGYSYDTKDDDVFKTNHQICPWDALREEDRDYHRNMARAMIDTSMVSLPDRQEED